MDSFGNDFGRFWNFEIFFDFSENFLRFETPWKTGQKIFEKFAPKHVQNTFGYIWERFWAFLEFRKKILENFRKLDPPWNTGHKIFSKKITLKHVWILLGTLLGNFGILKLFFFENFRKLDIPWKTGQKFFEKFAPKHVQNRFGYFWERFWAFLNFENFLIFRKIFEDSTLHGTLGTKFFKKFSPKHVQNTFGYFWQQFWAF